MNIYDASYITDKFSYSSDALPFFEKADGYLYTQQCESLEVSLENTSRLYFPVETDTEYWHHRYQINNPTTEIAKTLTVQHRAVSLPSGVVFTHPDSVPVARHSLAGCGFTPVDYLRSLGFEASLSRSKTSQPLPVMQFDIYGYFLVAELYRIVLGDYRRDINGLIAGNNRADASISMGRRLIAQTVLKGNRAEQFIHLPWILTLNGFRFQVAVSFFDCCAVHGNASYATFSENSGVKLLYKDNFTKDEKALMDYQYQYKPTDFDNYALGDLYCYNALLGNMNKFLTIYNSLGIERYFEPPRLTIGATVARILRSSMLNHLNLEKEDKNKVIELCRYGTAAHIKTMRNTTAVYNAKVDGGRCRNNRPTHVSVNKPIADVDIAGCYGNGLKHQDFPFGRPVIIDYPIKSDNNKYYTLRKFLKQFGGELVPGLWQARVSTPKDYKLKYQQDFLMSWIPPKDPSKIPTDTELESVDWFSEDNIGVIKVFSHEVNLGLITQEFLDWLENTASVRQRAELLDNLLVITAMFYPKSEECADAVEFFNAIDEHKGKNLCDVKSKRRGTKKISIEQECHAWLRVNLGDLLVIQLLAERGKYDKKNPFEKPLNELYKLCINTIYGDMVSPFFDISNVVVGNNITARARAMAWYMEKGLNGYQTITDGCVFELNQVVYNSKERITAETVFNELDDSRKNYKLQPISGVDWIELKDSVEGLVIYIHSGNNVTELDNYKAKDWLANQVSIHLKQVFPNIPVIDKFSFEIKDIFDSGAFHGTANYKLRRFGISDNGKMRSYNSKTDYNAYTLTGDELQLITSEYKPSEGFLYSLMTNPEKVMRSLPYIQSKILKISEYKNNYESRWINSQAHPGCTIENARLLRECSLTQFTFQTYKQFQSWEREAKRLRDLTGQTYESWFLNDDGTLNFKAMVLELNKLIRSGVMRFSQSRKSSENNHLAREYQEHPQYPALMRLKSKLGIRYGFIADDGTEDVVIDIQDVDMEEYQCI